MQNKRDREAVVSDRDGRTETEGTYVRPYMRGGGGSKRDKVLQPKNYTQLMKNRKHLEIERGNVYKLLLYV